MVSGLKRGDQSDAVPDPELVTRRVGFELHPEALALLTARRAALAAALGRAPTDDEFIVALCTPDETRSERTTYEADDGEIGPTGDCEDAHGSLLLAKQVAPAINSSPTPRVPPPRAQQIILTRKHCARSELLVDGEALALDVCTAERLTCDVELIGDADSEEHTRVTSRIPAALRRKVFARDKFCCVVPGCTARQFLDVHHVVHREHGGTHSMSNLALLCFHHHKSHHDGLLAIEGTAPHRLEFRWSHVGPN